MSRNVTQEKDEFVLFRDIGDGHRWRLRSPIGEALAASPRRHKERDPCEAELRADMAVHLGAEVLDATVTGEPG